MGHQPAPSRCPVEAGGGREEPRRAEESHRRPPGHPSRGEAGRSAGIGCILKPEPVGLHVECEGDREREREGERE